MKCKGCRRKPEEIEEMKVMENMTPSEFVKRLEGTYNRMDGTLYCTDCYISAGMPVMEVY